MSLSHFPFPLDGGGGGYPIQSWTEGGGFTPPSPNGGGVHLPVLDGGEVTHPVLGGGYPEVPPDLDGGVPPIQTWDGEPPVQTWDGVPPHPDLRMGYPPNRPGNGVPPASVDRQTENITFPHSSV